MNVHLLLALAGFAGAFVVIFILMVLARGRRTRETDREPDANLLSSGSVTPPELPAHSHYDGGHHS